MTLFAAAGLVKSYGRRKVVDNVSLQMDYGEVVGLLGRNGAGKTTTFRMIIGLVTPDGGRIEFNGTDISRVAIYKRARLGIGFLPQEPSVFQRLTLEENIIAVLELRGSTIDKRAQSDELLKQYGLYELRNRLACTLSGGERRRLEICRALATSPKIMLLDEPFSGVDPIAVNELQTIIRGLKKQNIGVFLTDHNVRETLQVTDRSYIIDDGKVIASGSPDEIVNNKIVRDRYLGEHFRL
jgi:lipopolysaccharide export system ATP-binding protein